MLWQWFKELHYARQRRYDLEHLWPACREQAKDLTLAKKAFALHICSDPAWLSLSADHVKQIFDTLD